jgi:DNA-binding SARP family transcriptional activator/tetratricopeptide (TPR) repeat protein
VELDGLELVGSLRGRQVRLLLAYLVLNRERAIGREELIGAIWPDVAPRSQDAALRTILSRLRSTLGAAALVGRDELALELPEPAWVDLEAAIDEVARATSALERDDARAAWALAQVPLNIAGRGLLPGIQATWLEPRRRELTDIRLQALEIIGRAGLRLGGTQLGSVERAGRTLVETEPYRESGYVLLMGALGAQGNVAEGLRIYERLRALLREELGTMPSQEAIAAHERLLHPGDGTAPRDGATPAGESAEIELPAELGAGSATPLVGRRDELATLERWWSGEDSERERVLLLGGEAGVGKSRLLARTAHEVHASGAVVLAGRASEEALVPYQPFLEAIGHYAFHASLPQLRAATQHSGSELTRLIPGLARRLPELPAPEPGDPETDRYRLFEAVAGLLGQIAATGSLLIVLDDLHWADRPTLLLLRHLIRSPQSGQLRIVGAYRAGEPWSEWFGAALAGLRREGLMRQLDVAGLPERDAVELVRLRAGGTPSAGFLEALHAETEGNPFFIEEIVRHLADSGVPAYEAGVGELRRFGLPEDVRDLISRRLERLGSESLEWLRVAAVIGRDFDSALLEQVLGFDEDRFLAALEEALDAGLVAESPARAGRYTFAHALVREALYAGMSSNRRARLHHRVGLALEEAGGAPVGALAHHFTRAVEPQDAERAIRYALEAGAQATEMLANEEAADHYERALEVLERADPTSRERRCALLLELGEARTRSGERPAAWPAFREAAALAVQIGDSASLARAAIGASRRYIQPPGVVDEEMISLLEQALELTSGERTVTRVVLLSRLCVALYFSSRQDRMRRLSAEATSIAAHIGRPEAAALAAAARRRAYWGPGHLERRLADSTQLLRAAREADDSELTLQGHAWLVVDLLEVGDRTAVEAQVEAFTAVAEGLRQPLYLWNAAVWRAMLALLDGHLGEADRLATDALTSGIRPEGITAPQYYAIQLLGIRREQLRMAELEPAARELVASNPARLAWRAGIATLLSDTGRPDEARAELEALAEVAVIPPDGDWMITIALLSDLAAELGDAARAETLYAQLAPHAETAVVVGVGALCMGSSARYLGRLALAMERREDALHHLEHAIARNTALGATVHLAHSRVDYAVALGRGARARELLDEVEATVREFDLPFVARRAQRARAVVD